MKEQQKHGNNWPAYLGFAALGAFALFAAASSDPNPGEAGIMLVLAVVVCLAVCFVFAVVYRTARAGVKQAGFWYGHSKRMAELQEEKLRRDLAAK